ncbi:MAG: hypothetical protein IJW21_03180 [Clostridia bacterium]|nr:hypothetical protein [Clostridia bacterium]
MAPELIRECELYMERGGNAPAAADKRSFKMFDISVSEADAYLLCNRGLSFNEHLFMLIDRTGRRDSDIYKKAFIDRRLFSKIRSNKNYVPSKKTVIALCLALELERGEADALLSSAGYSLSRADDYELAIAFCIDKKIFNFFDINEIMVHFGFEVF